MKRKANLYEIMIDSAYGSRNVYGILFETGARGRGIKVAHFNPIGVVHLKMTKEDELAKSKNGGDGFSDLKVQSVAVLRRNYGSTEHSFAGITDLLN